MYPLRVPTYTSAGDALKLYGFTGNRLAYLRYAPAVSVRLKPSAFRPAGTPVPAYLWTAVLLLRADAKVPP